MARDSADQAGLDDVVGLDEDTQRQLEGVANAVQAALLNVSRGAEQFRDYMTMASRRWESLLTAIDGLREYVRQVVLAIPNLGDALHGFRAIEACAREDGVPIIWVPDQNVAKLVLDAADRDARVAILLAHETAVLDACQRVVGEVTHPDLAELAGFARVAVDAHRAELPAAAQALAVVICEALINGMLGRRRYAQHQKKVEEMGKLPIDYMRSIFCMWPVTQFYESWRPGDPLPERPNRHTTTHEFVQAFSREHALVTVMLMSSLLREWHELGAQLVPMPA